MTHLILAVQADFPDTIAPQAIDKLIKRLSSKIYKSKIAPETGWSQIRPREIRLFDFTIPESAFEEVMLDLAPLCGGKLTKLSKVFELPIVGKLIESKLGAKPVDVEAYQKKSQELGVVINKQEPARLAILCEIPDDHIDGLEMI